MKSVTRRDALKTLATVTALAALPDVRTAEAGSALVLSPAPSGKLRHSACRWCYSKIPMETFAQAVGALGVESIELLDPVDWPVLRKYNLTCAMAKGTTTIPKGFNRLENHEGFVASMTARIKECADAGLPNVICFSGNREGMADEQGLENCVVGLKQIMAVAEKSRVTVCMELLNSKVNHKDYMCDRTAWGVELCKRVGSERFKLLYDIYHMQIMEGDVIRTITENHPYIAHYHTGGVPGRHEIDDGQELYYPAIMKAIVATGYTDFIGQEFAPARDPLTSLRESVRICTV